MRCWICWHEEDLHHSSSSSFDAATDVDAIVVVGALVATLGAAFVVKAGRGVEWGIVFLGSLVFRKKDFERLKFVNRQYSMYCPLS